MCQFHNVFDCCFHPILIVIHSHSEVKNKEKEEQPDSDFDFTGVAADEQEASLTVHKGVERSALHTAVCMGSYQNVEEILQRHQSDEGDDASGKVKLRELLCALDHVGFTPLHSAVTLPGSEGSVALDMTRLLITAGAVATCTDSYGNTPLHWAARVGNVGVMNTLVLENCPLGKSLWYADADSTTSFTRLTQSNMHALLVWVPYQI